jgi:hypothetical protein
MGKPQGEGNGRGPRSKRAGATYVFDDERATQWLLSLCVGAALSGGAIRIGLTRDMGAVAIGVYQGDDYGTEYVRPNENLEVAIREIAQGWGIPCAVWDNDAGRWIIA